MSIYIEKSDKLNLNVSNLGNEIKISVDCFNVTMASVAFKTDVTKVVHCGETKGIDTALKLKAQAKTFKGSANNPIKGPIKILHRIFEEGGNEIFYTFPQDYTGDQPYDNDDPNPSFTFFVNFK